MKKRLITVLLTLILFVTLLPIGATAEGSVDISTITPATAPITVNYCFKYSGTETESEKIPSPESYYPLNGGSYCLSADVTLDKPLVVSGGTAESPVILDLRGHTLTYSNSDRLSSVIIIADGAYFKLISSAEEAGVITGGTGSCFDATLPTATSGGGVFMGENARLEAENITIKNCSASYGNGGGVFVGKKSVFNMSNSSITDCNSNFGYSGGVQLFEHAEFTMSNSRIANCSAYLGGGVGLYCRACFTMKSGSIIEGCRITAENIEAWQSGGVSNNGTLIMNSGAIIRDCRTADGRESAVFSGGGGANLSGAIIANGGRIEGAVWNGSNSFIRCDSGIDTPTEFFGEVENRYTSHAEFTEKPTIEGGIFHGRVLNGAEGVIKGGTFLDEVENVGGSYTAYCIVSYANSTIAGGSFYGNVVNGHQEGAEPSTITGGSFYGGITDEGGEVTGKSITVSFDSRGGSAVPAQVFVGENAVSAKPKKPTEPTKAGYNFSGWYKGGAVWNFEKDTAEESITLSAEWTEINKAEDKKPSTKAEEKAYTKSPDTADSGTAVWAVLALTSYAAMVWSKKRR